ncbi:MAG: apolipoprotein N-acyltransferase [Candidatus Latescibacteria bacterium]|nr:apolipoprotein N-acyltransferase [Candidatus Latescibacterota bacterium]
MFAFPARRSALLSRNSLQRWLPPLFSGVLLALAFPCHPQNPFAFLFNPAWAYIALVPLLASLQGGSFKEGFRRAWAAGLAFNLMGLYWVAYTQGGGLAVVAGTALMALYLGLFNGLFGGALNILAARLGPVALAAAPFLWTAAEYLLSLGELGFPWLLLGHSQAAFPSLIQYASITGVYGVSFWLVVGNSLLASLLNSRPARAVALATGAALTLLLPWLHGRSLLAQTQTSAATMRVALIQPNLAFAEKWGPEGLDRSIELLAKLSFSAARQQPDLVVWPETALPCYLQTQANCRQPISALVDSMDVQLLTGASDYDYDRRQPYNAAFLVNPQGQSIQSYAKMHLVPFGERTPYRDSIPLLRAIDWSRLTGALGPTEFAPGREQTLFAHPAGDFAVLICFESVFPDLVRRSVSQGARLLVNITNDSWFGRTAGPYQHAQLAVFRAVENRRPVARCATSGISLFIDTFGRPRQATDIFTQAVRVDDLTLASETTFYTRHGDLFAQLALGVSCSLLLCALLPAQWIKTSYVR